MLYILYHKIPWWPVQREREGGGGGRKLVQLYIGKQGRNRGGGTVPWIVHREEHVVGRSIPLRLEEEEETGGRAEERVNRGAVSLWSVGFVASSNCSSPRPSSLVPPGFDRSIGRNVTGPRHSRQSWWVRFLWDKGKQQRKKRFKSLFLT